MAEPATPVTPPLEQSAAPKSRTHPGAWIGVIAAVSAGALLIAAVDQAPSPEDDRNAAESYLPADGDVRLVSYADGAKWIVETGFSTGIPYLLQQPPYSGEYQITFLESLGLVPQQQRFWRQTWTDVAGDRGQLTELYHLTNAGVRMMALTGNEIGFSYFPGLIALPADVRDGSTWSSEGDALPQSFLQYSSTGSATAAADGCLSVTLDVTYTDPGQPDAPWLTTTDTSTWCPGRGSLDATFVNDGVEGSTRVTGIGARTVDGALAHPAGDFSGAAEWTSEAVPLLNRDPIFGESAINGTTDARAATTASGVLFANTGPDVMGYALEEDGAYTRQWIAHPGGEVTQLTAIGDAILIATTERVLQAYDDHGRRAWSSSFDDIVDAMPVSDGDGGAIVLSLDGELRRIGLSKGEEKWSARLAGDSDIAPAVAGGAVFTLDRSESLRAFDLSTGEPLWSVDFADGAFVTAGDGVVYAADDFGTVAAFDAETGALHWAAALPGVVETGTVLGDRLVVQGTEGTAAYSPEGEVLWRTPENDGLLADGERVLLMGYDAVSAYDREGALLASWPTQRDALSVTRALLTAPDGFWVLDTSFQATGVWSR